MISSLMKNLFFISILLYTTPININGYVPSLINTLDTIVRGGMLNSYHKQWFTFFTLLVSIVFC